MKKIFVSIIIGFTGITPFNAQSTNESFEENFNRGEQIFSQVYKDGKEESLTISKEGYADALPFFLYLYKQDPTNMNLAFKIGVCYHGLRKDRAQAIPYLEKAVNAVSLDYKGSAYAERYAPTMAYKFMGDAYHLNYQFDAAIDAYDKFIASYTNIKNRDKEIIAEANQKIAMCNAGKRLVADPIKVNIVNLGSAVNSAHADYSPVLSADQERLYFTSRRPGSTGAELDADGNFMEDIYMSTKTRSGWSKAENIGLPLNTKWHEATVGISPDGQTILIYKDDEGIGNIYSTSLNGDKWSEPVKLNNNINTKHWEPSAFISADGNTLYFTSNRPGGYGGRDLYTSTKSSDGDWGNATNMGPVINTPFDEDAPYIHPDGVTLAFSSNGHNTMGGFDIFTSTLSYDGTWSNPENIGYPINTTDDDIFYMTSPDGKKAYFSSFRANGQGGKDIYELTFLQKKPTPLTLIKGNVNYAVGNLSNKVQIIITDNETEQVVGVYNANTNTGEFLFILIPGRNYNITYLSDNHLFYSENVEIPKESEYYEIKKEVPLYPIAVGSKIVLNNIFFDFDKSTLRPQSNVELKNLVLLMKNNPGLKVEIAGHTDSKGESNYNQKLSEQRAQAVVNKLIASGINANRLKAKGYGKTKPAARNKKADGTDNPTGRQLNRRVELTITEFKQIKK